MVAIVYGSSTMNTEYVSQRIAAAFGETADLHNVRDTTADLFLNRSSFVLVTSTWGAGDLQDDWEVFFPTLKTVDFSGKTVGLVGVGDQENYPDTFCDSIAILHEALSAQGARFVGSTAAEGYTFKRSRAERDGVFLGLVLDEDNQADQTDERIRQWVATVRSDLL